MDRDDYEDPDDYDYDEVGNCFSKAFEVACGFEHEGRDGVYIVHAIVVARGGPIMGLRYWHAWAEAEGIAYDHSNGGVIEVPHILFERLGQATHLRRYTVKEAAGLVLEHDHLGPWVDGWDTLVDVS